MFFSPYDGVVDDNFMEKFFHSIYKFVGEVYTETAVNFEKLQLILKKDRRWL